MSDDAASPSAAAPADGVHRLLDMLVEEVSLVDRPANKQRFLVVKRESEMPRKKTEEKTPAAKTAVPAAVPPPAASAKAKKPDAKKPPKPEDEETEKAKKTPPSGNPPDEEEEEEPPPGKKASKAFPPKKKDPEEEEEEEEEEQEQEQEQEPEDAPADEDKPGGKKPPKPAAKDEEGAPEPGAPDDEAADDAGTPLAVALAALDSLTQAVEILSSSPDDGSQLASVAQDIKAAADAISTAAGIEAEEEAAEGEGGNDASIAGLVSSIQEMLTKIDSLTQALSSSSKTPAAAPTSTTETQAPPDLAGTLAEVAQSMKSLDASVKAQATRLEMLEKRAGLPNSQPAGERVTKNQPDDETSWPVDMNRPRDRASVDKSTSFHDV